MAVEFSYAEEQLIAAGGNAVLNNSILCPYGLVFQDNGTGLINLRGIPNNMCSQWAQYQITAQGNIAIPTGGTVGAISVAFVENGGEIQSAKSIATPAAVNEFWPFFINKIVTVRKGCCPIFLIKNALPGVDPTTEVAQAILMRNLNVTVTKVA